MFTFFCSSLKWVSKELLSFAKQILVRESGLLLTCQDLNLLQSVSQIGAFDYPDSANQKILKKHNVPPSCKTKRNRIFYGGRVVTIHQISAEP